MSTVSSSIASAVSAASASATTAWYEFNDVQLDPEFLRFQKEIQGSIKSFLTPLNLTIAALILTVVYLRARSSSNPADVALDPTRPITFRTFTPRTLLKYNGEKNPLNVNASVYLAVRGKVYDVSPGRNFYGPGGPYENFAGRDATRGLACQSFDDDMLTKNLDGPLDPCDDLDADQVENLKGWIERFDEKYLIVGRLTQYNKGASEF